MSQKASKSDAIALDLRVKKVVDSFSNTTEEVSELDPRWKEDIKLVCYRPLPLQRLPGCTEPIITDDASLEEWKERASFINDDLKWLLCLPHNRFWCQVIFDECLQACLDSYLKCAPRIFDLWDVAVPEELADLQNSLHKRIFMVFLRMSTHKESKECFFTPSTFGEILYNNFLFDIPKIMDICAVYGGPESENLPLLKKMFENVFDKQPKYYNDLEETIPTLIETFNNLLAKYGLDNITDNTPQKLSDKTPSSSKHTVSQDELVDVVSYISDIGHTLIAFMSTFPSSCQYFFKHGLVPNLASFFEVMIPFLESKLITKEVKRVRHQLKLVMTLLARVCNIVLRTCCIEPLLASVKTSSFEEMQKHIEDFSQVFMSILSEKRFVSRYDAQFSIEDDLITIQSCAGCALDATRVQYIVQAVHSAHDAFPEKRKKTGTNKTAIREQTQHDDNGPTQHDVNGLVEQPRGPQTDAQVSHTNQEETASLPSSHMNGVELDSMVTNVRDLLPELGEGFVMKCLEEYNYDMEKVINAVLENHLSDKLDKLDRVMTREQALEPENDSKTIISTRHSVFDKDEFDIFAHGHKIDLSRVHKGKKRDQTNFKSLLAEKSYVTDSVKERFSRYDVYGQLTKPEGFDDEYDDEYDDTYDSVDIGAQDDGSVDQLAARRPFVVPRVLGKPAEESSESEDEQGDDEPGETADTQTKWRNPDKRPGNRGFYTDGYANRGRGQPQGRGGGQARQSTGENKGQKAQGKAKGPPDPATLRNRSNNERHKSQRANHNRKTGAERKRNKGMGALPPQ